MIITVTSARPGEGKSTIIKQRAEESNKKVIIIDLDVYQPVLADRFNVKEEGIIEYLDGKELNIVSINNIDFIPCTKSKKTLKEVLENSKFTELLINLAEKYDEVYIDAPPICTTPDVKKLFNLCDGVIMVKANEWSIYTEKRIRKFFEGINIIETVYNKIPYKSIRR